MELGAGRGPGDILFFFTSLAARPGMCNVPSCGHGVAGMCARRRGQAGHLGRTPEPRELRDRGHRGDREGCGPCREMRRKRPGLAQGRTSPGRKEKLNVGLCFSSKVSAPSD